MRKPYIELISTIGESDPSLSKTILYFFKNQINIFSYFLCLIYFQRNWALCIKKYTSPNVSSDPHAQHYDDLEAEGEVQKVTMWIQIYKSSLQIEKSEQKQKDVYKNLL